MKKLLSIAIILCLILYLSCSGCMRFNPLSPRHQQRLNNSGQIEELKTNQNSAVFDALKYRQDQDITCENGICRTNTQDNSGTQILSG